MEQADRDAQQIACNTPSSMHGPECLRRYRPAGELFTGNAVACYCWVVTSARNVIRKQWGE